MITLSEKMHVLQNMGLIDRLFRVVLGAAMMGFAFYYDAVADMSTRVWDVWGSYLMAIAIYPILTAIVGWDPLYAMFHAKSCGDTGRNQCGSLPYQFKAMAGHAPKFCEADTERSLESCHEEAAEHPHHKVWRVDEEPELYPDDRAWHSFFMKRRAGGNK